MIEKSRKKGGLHWHTLGSRLFENATLLDADDLTAIIKELFGGGELMNKNNNPLAGLAGMFGLGGNSGNPLGALSGMFGGNTGTQGQGANPLDILGAISSLSSLSSFGGNAPNTNTQNAPVNNQGNGTRGNRRPPPREPARERSAESGSRQETASSRPRWNYSEAAQRGRTPSPRWSNRPDISNMKMPQRYGESREPDLNDIKRDSPPREQTPGESLDNDSMWYFGEGRYK